MLNHSKAELMRLLKDVLCQHEDWKPKYMGIYCKKEEGDGQLHAGDSTDMTPTKHISRVKPRNQEEGNDVNYASLDNLCDAMICAFTCKISMGDVHVDIRARRINKRTGKTLDIMVKELVLIRQKWNATTVINMDTLQENVAYATLKEQYDNLSSHYKKSQFKESVEARLAHYKKNETVFEERINVLKLEVRLRDNALNGYKMNLEKAEKERDQLKQTLENYCSRVDQQKVSSMLGKFTDKSGSDKWISHQSPPLCRLNLDANEDEATLDAPIIEYMEL
ncbi:hypothetical protein Tco_0337691 [Tanacetum coccineum]